MAGTAWAERHWSAGGTVFPIDHKLLRTRSLPPPNHRAFSAVQVAIQQPPDGSTGLFAIRRQLACSPAGDRSTERLHIRRRCRSTAKIFTAVTKRQTLCSLPGPLGVAGLNFIRTADFLAEIAVQRCRIVGQITAAQRVGVEGHARMFTNR